MQDATIYTIAEKANCSASTVSRVINNYPYVKKATRAKVLKLLHEYNYVPNETARSLVNRASRMIGIMIADIRTTQHTDAIYYLESEFSKSGYSCLIINTGRDPEKVVDSLSQLKQRKVEGIVMIGSTFQQQAVADAIGLYLPDIPVIMINGFLDGPNIYGIVSDEGLGIFNSVKFLAEHGKKHTAMVVDYLTPSNKNKIEGYKTGLNSFMPNEKEHIVIASKGGDIYDGTVKLIKENKTLDSIIFAEDFIALIGLQALHDNGIKIPEEIAVIGVNNSRYSRVSFPKLTTLDNMLYDISLTAVRNMFAIFRGEQVNKRMVICSKLVERETT